MTVNIPRDWLAHWRALYDAERAQAERIPAPERRTDCWHGQAARFAAAERRIQQPDAFLRFVLPHLRPTDTLVDVGAGSGRHTSYLATQVAHITALEPSAAMRAQLAERVSSTRNVTVIDGGFPGAPVPIADVAICAHVVYSIREIGSFLQALDATTRRACFLAVGLQAPGAVLAPFWQHIRGEARLPLPGALDCLQACHQLGIPAQLNLIPATPFRFASAAEALADLRWRVRLPADAASDAQIQSAMHDLLEHDADGGLRPRGQPTYSAVIWWETNKRDG